MLQNGLGKGLWWPLLLRGLSLSRVPSGCWRPGRSCVSVHPCGTRGACGLRDQDAVLFCPSSSVKSRRRGASKRDFGCHAIVFGCLLRSFVGGCQSSFLLQRGRLRRFFLGSEEIGAAKGAGAMLQRRGAPARTGVAAPPPFWVGILPFCWLPEGVCDPGPGCGRDQEAPSALSHGDVSPAPRALGPDGCSGSRGDVGAGPQHQLLPFVFLRSHFTRWLSGHRCRGMLRGSELQTAANGEYSPALLPSNRFYYM